MNSPEQTTVVGAESGLDKVKNWLAIALVIGGVAAFYLQSTRPEWQRWLMMVAGLVLGVVVFLTSHTGKRFWRFVMDSRIELRKVVWPQRQETMTTTIVIFVFMAVAGFGFWLLDLFLAWATRQLTGQGG